MYVSAQIEDYPYLWKAGNEIVEVKVTLGQGERSSTGSVVLADIDGMIGAELIKHSLETGGIQALPQPQAQIQGGSGLSGVQTDGTVAPTKGDRIPTGSVAATELTPEEKAFLDVLAYAEGTTVGSTYNGYDTVGGYGPTGEASNRYNIKNFANHPYLTGEYDPIANGFSSDVAGRYQFKSDTWQETRMPDFSPASQDRAAMKRVDFRGAREAVRAGDIDRAVALTNLEWASLPGSPYGQPVITIEECRTIFAQRLAYYRGEGGNAGAPAKQTTPDPTGGTGVVSPDPLIPANTTFKGKKLYITIGEKTFEFYHQSTVMEHTGKTEIGGQGIRWVMNRRKRNRTIQNKSLKQLAEEVAKEHKFKLDWQSDLDPQYEHIDQTGISDYQLLQREASQAGLFLSEENGTLTIKDLTKVKDTKLVLSPGNNLIDWKVSDVALDGSKEDKSEGSALRQNEIKIDLDPVTGQLKNKLPDVDPNKTPSVTGTTADKPTATLKPGNDGPVAQSRSRYKRVKGLPSSFTIPLSKESLEIQPLDAVRTMGLPGTLSRVWMVDAVTHNIPAFTTKLSCYSPVEVLDLSPQASAVAASTSGGPPAATIGGWRPPVTGYPVTSLRGPRVPPVPGASSFHKGVDFGTPEGTPVFAMNDGICKHSGWISGYGLTVIIRHPDNRETLYAHLSQPQVRVGENVKGGQQIALSGNTGIGSGAHLHVEVSEPGSIASVNFSAVGLRDLAIGESY